MERSDDETTAPVGEAVFEVVGELWAAGFCEGSGVNAPAGSVVVIEGRNLELVKVTRKGCQSRVEGVVSGGVDPALEAVFDYDILVDPDGPTWKPRGEVILQVEALDPLKLRGVLRQPRLKARVMVAKRPIQLRSVGGVLDLSKPLFARFQLFDH